MSRRSRRLAAFTLLEVMAAVLVLGLLYTVLAEAAIRGLRSEGVSRRRVEASLIADRFLADLEAQVALGEIPPSGSEEQEIDPYRVGINVQPFDPTPLLEAIEKVEKERGIERKPRPQSGSSGAASTRTPAEALAGGRAGSPTSPAAPVESLLEAPRTGADGRLRRIDISVAWQEGDREERVLRTTFVFDTSGLEAVFPEKESGAAGADGEAAAGPNPQDLEGLDQEEAVSRMREIMEQMGGAK